MKARKTDEGAVIAALKKIALPDGSGNFADPKILAGVSARGETCGVVLRGVAKGMADYLQGKLDKDAAFLRAKVIVSDSEKPASNASAKARLPGVSRIIAVGAGKGGVGKSAVSAALALRLQAQGKRAALLDADIYGPSFPSMFDIRDKPKLRADSEKMTPALYRGVQVMSVGFIVEPDKALAWRGPMASKTVMQLISGTEWDADILIIDLPPGTGDAALSLCSHIAIDGAVIVTQPHALSIDDAVRAGAMFSQLGVPVLGVIENMAHIDAGGQILYPFGQGGGQKTAEKCGAPLLASLPIFAEAGNDKPFLAMAEALPNDAAALF